MKVASLLIILLSNSGYWFGGREATITIRAAARGGPPAAEISWELRFDQTRLANGKAVFVSGNSPLVIRVRPPECRTRLLLHWVYRLTATDTGRNLGSGDIPVHTFPEDITDGLSQRLEGRSLVVWDKADALPTLLDHAKVPYSRVGDSSALQVARPSIVLVGADAIGASPFAQSPLFGLARGGASVMIFRQSDLPTEMGYALADRDVPAKLEWRLDHPLLRDLEFEDLQSWIRPLKSIRAIRLPADEPALELGYYPVEVEGPAATPIDAVLMTKTMGKGRVVLCQIPLARWTDDPRSQILLRNAIDYLLTRPAPTPPPAERRIARAEWPTTVPTISISPGGQP